MSTAPEAEQDRRRGSGPAAVQARDILKTFDGHVANKDVSLSIHRGEVHAVLGENGAGKSTLISILSGVYRPDAGEVLVHGAPAAFRGPRDALAAGIGVVYQELKLIGNLTVLENVLLGTGERPSPQAHAHFAKVVRDAGFDLDPDMKVCDLDIARRQQVEIAKLLLRDLEVLIFDEPTAVLGEAQVGELFASMEALRRQGKAIVLVTHRLREVRAIADRLTILRGGEVRIHDRAPSEFSDPELTELMVGAGLSAPAPRAPACPGAPVLMLEGVHAPSVSGSGLRGVSFAVHAGEVVGVAGVRGNGQREVAEIAADLLAPEQGRVTRAAEDTAFIPEDRLGMGLSRRMTIAENLALRRYRQGPIARPLRLDHRAMRRFAERLIADYEIPGKPDWTVTRLSGGGLQRIVVARELERGTPLIVAAQPTRGLDVRATDFVRGQLVRAAGRGAGVLVISEDLDELMQLADRIVVLFEGHLASITGREAFNRQALGALMLGGEREGTGHDVLAV